MMRKMFYRFFFRETEEKKVFKENIKKNSNVLTTFNKSFHRNLIRNEMSSVESFHVHFNDSSLLSSYVRRQIFFRQSPEKQLTETNSWKLNQLNLNGELRIRLTEISSLKVFRDHSLETKTKSFCDKIKSMKCTECGPFDVQILDTIFSFFFVLCFVVSAFAMKLNVHSVFIFDQNGKNFGQF